MNKIDLTIHGDQELSMQVFNDEGLYRQRHRRGFNKILDEIFIYTSEQLEVLEQDLKDELCE
jgi:hypothetical protein